MLVKCRLRDYELIGFLISDKYRNVYVISRSITNIAHISEVLFAGENVSENSINRPNKRGSILTLCAFIEIYGLPISAKQENVLFEFETKIIF